MKTTHTTTASTIEDWLSNHSEWMIENSEVSLYVNEQYSIHLIGKRVIHNHNTLEVDKFTTAADAETRFDTYHTPDFDNDVIIGHHDGRYSASMGDAGAKRIERFGELANLFPLIEAAMEAAGVYPNVWFDYSYGRGTGWALINTQTGDRIPESDDVRYV